MSMCIVCVWTHLRYTALVVTSEVPGVGAGLHGWLHAWIAHAGLAVRLQFLPVGTPTPGGYSCRRGRVVRYRETELLTTTSVCVAGVVVGNQLRLLGENLDSVETI